MIVEVVVLSNGAGIPVGSKGRILRLVGPDRQGKNGNVWIVQFSSRRVMLADSELRRV
jgi:hypothetical protein